MCEMSAKREKNICFPPFSVKDNIRLDKRSFESNVFEMKKKKAKYEI